MQRCLGRSDGTAAGPTARVCPVLEVLSGTPMGDPARSRVQASSNGRGALEDSLHHLNWVRTADRQPPSSSLQTLNLDLTLNLRAP